VQILTERMRSPGVLQLLNEPMKILPQVDLLAVIGADGHLLNRSRVLPDAPPDFSQRAYFQYLSTHDDADIFVGAPAQAHSTGTWTAYLVRCINGADHEFAGIVAAAVALLYFEQFY